MRYWGAALGLGLRPRRFRRWPVGLAACCSGGLSAVCCGRLGRLLRGLLGAGASLAGASVAARAGRWRGRVFVAAPFRELGALGAACAGRLPLGPDFVAPGGCAPLSVGVSLLSSFESLRVTDLRTVGMLLVNLEDDGHEKGAPGFERAPLTAIQFYDRAHSFLPVYHWRPILSKRNAASLWHFGTGIHGGGGIRRPSGCAPGRHEVPMLAFPDD